MSVFYQFMLKRGYNKKDGVILQIFRGTPVKHEGETRNYDCKKFLKLQFAFYQLGLAFASEGKLLGRQWISKLNQNIKNIANVHI